MPNANPTWHPNRPFPATASKPRAARFTGPVSAAKRKSRIETQFLLRWHGPAFVTEHRFHDVKQYRLDYAWPAAKVGLEIEGGIFRRKGAHNTGMAIARDIDKGNLALVSDWIIFRACDKTDLNSLIDSLAIVIAERTRTTNPANAG